MWTHCYLAFCQRLGLKRLVQRCLRPTPRAREYQVFDLNSLVLVIYGHAEGARVGYNPKKRGRRSYHPLLCFEAHRQELWPGSLRSGNTVAATGAAPFLRVGLAKVPPGVARARLRVRGDAGFFGKRVVELLDGEEVGYALVAREYQPIKALAQGCRLQKLRSGWEVGEFRYQPDRWRHPHRFVVVLRPIPTDPVEAKQLTLFTDTKYVYYVLVTNLRTHPWRVWRFYAQRARIVEHLREVLYDYPLARIPTAERLPNVAFFQILLFAFDLVHYFTRLCLPLAYRVKTLKTVRRELLVIPGRLVKAGNRYRLKLPQKYHFQRTFEYALRKIRHLVPPGIG